MNATYTVSRTDPYGLIPRISSTAWSMMAAPLSPDPPLRLV